MSPVSPLSPAVSRTDRRPAVPRWWRDAVIYQVYVRSFADSDGDGVGDLPGIRARLPYLAGLGVDAVWLTPFYSSPQADGGYDVADYRAVDPLFGTLDDAAQLIAAAHEVGIRVIVDVVPNHTSDEHAWFRAALAGGPERDLYHFRQGRGENGELPPNDWESVFGGPAWTRTRDGSWYLHLFAPQQPDLNWDAPAVHAEFDSILRFWLDMGVDGFRVDVAHGMVKAAGMPDIGAREQAKMIGTQILPFFDQDEVHAIHREWRRLLDSYGGRHGRERIGVAEAWAPTPERLALYVRPDELHQAFNFQFLSCPWEPAAMRRVIDSSLAATGSVGAPTTWVLSNHDVVRHLTRYGADDYAGGLRRARAAALLMLALPGSVYLYQGEELGLPEVRDLPDGVRQDPSFFRTDGQDGLRDGCRVPIPWDGELPPYGFGSGGSWLPQPDDWRNLTVAAQTGDDGSTLELYRRALAVRRELPGLGDGEMEWLPSADGVLDFVRPGFRCVLNAGPEPVELPTPGRLLATSADLRTDGTAPHGDLGADGPTTTLPADTCTWWAIGRTAR
ncbi:glycoside hydrolase family 13 protein [Streptomyces sp. NPDC091272]|uniref:glycoside hydrolase family 13 protein n=1 Tax=Streptomyces sp. NPDC091272 TaxID=3365981 RepID=UPI003813C292